MLQVLQVFWPQVLHVLTPGQVGPPQVNSKQQGNSTPLVTDPWAKTVPEVESRRGAVSKDSTRRSSKSSLSFLISFILDFSK